MEPRQRVQTILNITKTKKLNFGTKEVDISKYLESHSEIEYRQEDIEKINIENFEKQKEKCEIKISALGSNNIPFDDKITKQYKRIAILDFASSLHPGGGFIKGAKAQEEVLCQSSNLYEILKSHEEFYKYNNSHKSKSLYVDGIIYVKDCAFFINNDKQVEPKLVDIIVCPAPNRGAAIKNGVQEKQIEDTMKRRIDQIFKVAIQNQTECLVLGAFGCGVFKNEPSKVATIMKNTLQDKEYEYYLRQVTFAMNGYTNANTIEFNKVLKEK